MSNKVSIKEIRSKVKASNSDPIKFTFGSGENTIDVEFQPRLSLTDEVLFIQRVVNGVFIGDEYHSEYRDISFINVLLDMMSNLSLPYVEQGGNKVVNLSILKDWDNIFNFKNTLYKYAQQNNDGFNSKEFDFIDYVVYLEDSVNEKINYIKEQNFNKSKADVLLETITDIVKKYGDKLKDINVNEVMATFKKVKSMDEGKFATAIVDHAKEKESKDNITKISDVKQ